MNIKFGNYLLDIDVEKTKKFYETAETITLGCDCLACCNYEKATNKFPTEVLNLFDKIGVDITKAAEIIAYASENDKKSISYGGFYHICGTLLSDTVLWNTSDSAVLHLNENKMYEITDGYRIGFKSECDLLEDNLPLPAVQMEISFTCPWVLEAENIY